MANRRRQGPTGKSDDSNDYRGLAGHLALGWPRHLSDEFQGQERHPRACEVFPSLPAENAYHDYVSKWPENSAIGLDLCEGGPMDTWSQCELSDPEEGIEVLVFRDWRPDFPLTRKQAARWVNGSWWDVDYLERLDHVTHWQPMPADPENLRGDFESVSIPPPEQIDAVLNDLLRGGLRRAMEVVKRLNR